jgi:hypothetical protein
MCALDFVPLYSWGYPLVPENSQALSLHASLRVRRTSHRVISLRSSSHPPILGGLAGVAAEQRQRRRSALAQKFLREFTSSGQRLFEDCRKVGQDQGTLLRNYARPSTLIQAPSISVRNGNGTMGSWIIRGVNVV